MGRDLQGQCSNPGVATLPTSPTAQQFFYQRAKCNGAARYGKYTSEMEAGVA